MSNDSFFSFFQGKALNYLIQTVETALSEDGVDLTSNALFDPDEKAEAVIKAKDLALLAGLPLVEVVLQQCSDLLDRPEWKEALSIKYHYQDGDFIDSGDIAVTIKAPALLVLKAERVALNFIARLCGIAGTTRAYAEQLRGLSVKLLDTRKTTPGLRYPEKYAVTVGGGFNHRLNLSEMLMLKDNHIDRAGGITPAVEKLRTAYSPCPPLEVECRNLEEVKEAVQCKVDRIMLDNMDVSMIKESLTLIPESIESEISGGVDLGSIRSLGELGPTYISVGNITHSAPAADLSMKVLI